MKRKPNLSLFNWLTDGHMQLGDMMSDTGRIYILNDGKTSQRILSYSICRPDVVTVCSVISVGLQLCFSVPDWSPKVLVLALLAVESGCFESTNWPVPGPWDIAPFITVAFPLALLKVLLFLVSTLRYFSSFSVLGKKQNKTNCNVPV